MGFMGAGKSTVGPEVACRLGRRLVSTDDLVEREAGASVEALFSERGEAAFRRLEEAAVTRALGDRSPAVIELGGGAVTSARTRDALEEAAFAVLLETSHEEAWSRVAGSNRPLARDPEAFRALLEERRPLYDAVANARATDPDGVVLAAAGVHVAEGAVDGLRELVPGDGPVELVVDESVDPIYGGRVRGSLGNRLRATHLVPAGERAKSVDVAVRLWSALRLDRAGTVVALGGGGTTDLAGFVAATYLRGVAWAPVPTTLVGQVDASIGGKTAIDVPEGKNLVGAFHWPSRAIVDPGLLVTLPDGELRNGLAEVVKTGLLAAERLWELPLAAQVRSAAAFKAALCLRDPHDRGDRAQLNLGHTFAHALESASGYSLPHGRAVASGLVAALRLSGLGEEAAEVEELLDVRPVAVDPEVAWSALLRDKKSLDGRVRLVLLERLGVPLIGVEVAERDVRSALDELII